ncbi:MAG: hypothetical protein IPK04_00910 [Bdellovibrionales bacterium]|nr:hypothetical protein [Bdellovibrionales bacterium]
MRQTETLNRLKASLVPGQVYRRADLAELSSNVDRHLAKLVTEGRLKKLSQGMYAAPRETAFGEAPPDADSLLRTFLKDDHFVVYGPSQFNSLGLGTTQLYNRLLVFNRKRVGEFTLGGRTYIFYRWREAPKKLTLEFLIVELLNRLDELAEDRDQVVERLRAKLKEFNRRKLLHAASRYGTLSTQKKLEALMTSAETKDA